MTFDELKQHLIAAGFQFRDPNAPEDPAPEPEKQPEQQPDPQPGQPAEPQPDYKALNESIKALTAALQANAINTITFDNPNPEQSAEDILGAMLAGPKPEKK